MRRDPKSSAVNGPVSAWLYTRAMMITRILTICAAVAATVAGTSLALAQAYPPGPYSSAPAPYPADYTRRPSPMDAMPDFDALDDEDAPPSRSATALPPPGPVMSPDDPRYGRPMGAPVYSDRTPYPGQVQQGQLPQGPVMSPDDPRYGRPAGPPPVIYSDRGNESGNRIPGSGFIYPD